MVACRVWRETMWFRKAKPVELRDGEVVKVTGIVRAVEPMVIAAVSGCECVGYETHARVGYGSVFEMMNGEHVLGELQQALARSRTARRITSFELEVADRRVLVEGFPAIRLSGLVARTIIPRRLDHERVILAEHGDGSLSLKTVSFGEVRIEVGDKVAVTGLVEIGPTHGESGFRDTPMQVRIVPPRGRAIEIRKP
jgi:hypothetical protein